MLSDSQAEDLNGLRFFIKKSHEIISYLVENSHVYVLKEFQEDRSFMEAVKDTWMEVAKSLNEIAERIGHELSPLHKGSSDLWNELQRCGLTGAQLKFKILLFNKLWLNFERTQEPRWLRRLLGHMNSVFGSLSLVFPGVEAISEFKDALEKIIKLRRWSRKMGQVFTNK